MKLIEVFKSSRKEDTYLYLERGADHNQLPDRLRSVFGEFQPVLSLQLTPERQLARYSGIDVLTAIEEHGFFLQMPFKDGVDSIDTAFANLDLDITCNLEVVNTKQTKSKQKDNDRC